VVLLSAFSTTIMDRATGENYGKRSKMQTQKGDHSNLFTAPAATKTTSLFGAHLTWINTKRLLFPVAREYTR
jgi:hypothetical protein